MPALNWDIFMNLPGSSEKNFELLCRGVVRTNFGSYGIFRALANQPGVEFHLKLDKRCSALGDSGRWWGWQCKWYDLAASGALGSTRRANIEEGLRKTEEHLPDLTDWVLWTRRTLTKADQTWFAGLTSKMKLHLWTGDDVDNLLTGQATTLRTTYFGELVLTPEILRERHEQAVAPIRTRWQPDVHHVREAERDLRRMLGEEDAWDVLHQIAAELRTSASAVESSPAVPAPIAHFVCGVVATAQQLASTLDRVSAAIGVGDLDLLRDELSARLRELPIQIAPAPRRLRADNQRAGLYATNSVAACRDAIRLLNEVETAFSSRLVAILASAGCGKTHLAAQFTAGIDVRPHGVLLHGRDLHANQTLDDLARRVSIAAQPVPSMEALLSAVDAAGQRAQKRLPVFIDGLNESEDPRTWKPLLAALETTLVKYPYVLLVCTLRPEFLDDVLPKGTLHLAVNDYGESTIDAIREHFRFWKIDATDMELPGFLSHPLTLRLFCEVTNAPRQQVVGSGAMPGSLTSLFERYLEQVSTRVVELAPRTHRFYAHDVKAAITAIANYLWNSGARSVEFAELRSMLGDAQRPWDQSLVRALEHEGVLLRMPSNGSDTFVPVYDLLGGHIIANALLATHDVNSFEAWIADPSTTERLAGGHNARHPLADDVLNSLVGQVPRRFYARQVWQMVDEPLQGRALRQAAQLEPSLLDAATIDMLMQLVQAGDAIILAKLWQMRGSEGHPLNAEGLDQALRTMSVADRDLQWTEWVRRNHEGGFGRGRSVSRDLEYLERRWRHGRVRRGDPLRARWVMWTLTSTVRRLRDQATRALYWFGRAHPEGLFALTIHSLSINDAYVGERMLAASYGVVMSHQQADMEFASRLGPFLQQLASTLTGQSAAEPTHHFLARLYVRGIVAFAAKFYPQSLPTALSGEWTFASPTLPHPLVDGDARADEAGRTLHIDFENYTLGRLFADRSNYDSDHSGHRSAVAHVRGVVWNLGWRAATFDTIDNRIGNDASRLGRGSTASIERYGKKYGRIGFFTYAGFLEEHGQDAQTWLEFSDVDIDPSFPEEPPSDGSPLVPDAWLSPALDSHETWMRAGSTNLPLNVLRRENIGERAGPWIAVHGRVNAGERVLGRYVWAFVSAMLVSKKDEPKLVAALNAGARPWCVRDMPRDYYTFAGEMPWSSRFAQIALSDDGYSESVRVGDEAVEIEALAHGYAWESYHSEMNETGSARVPSKAFSETFDLRSVAQSFDQFLPDGSDATITLRGIDGLSGDVLYIRENLLKQYVGDRAIVWLVSGERELRPYPSTPPQWLLDAQRQQVNAWREVLFDADVLQTRKKRGGRPKKAP